MSIKEIVDQESKTLSGGIREVLHLYREGSFYRAYEWSAFLACRYMHDFKVTKRVFKGIDEPVAFIGFPETSINKWMPEGAEQRSDEEKHLSVKLPDVLFAGDTPEVLVAAYVEWKEKVPLTESQSKGEKRTKTTDAVPLADNMCGNTTLTSVMQRILAFPIESKSPLESMAFLADVKRQLATMI